MNAIGLPSRRAARTMNARVKSDTLGGFFDIAGFPIVVAVVKIVAVYLKTNEYESAFASRRALEDLSEFNRAVVEEIDRRGIDAYVDDLTGKGSPMTFRFRAANGDFVWLPVFSYAVVVGPKEERAKKTVDRMLVAIGGVAKSLSGIDTGKSSPDSIDAVPSSE